jgi:hypothetical protein
LKRLDALSLVCCTTPCPELVEGRHPEPVEGSPWPR